MSTWKSGSMNGNASTTSIDRTAHSKAKPLTKRFGKSYKSTSTVSRRSPDATCPHRWRGRYNEDTILSLDILKDGLCTMQFNNLLQGKVNTQVLGGGNSGRSASGWAFLASDHPAIYRGRQRSEEASGGSSLIKTLTAEAGFRTRYLIYKSFLLVIKLSIRRKARLPKG